MFKHPFIVVAENWPQWFTPIYKKQFNAAHRVVVKVTPGRKKASEKINHLGSR